MPPPPGAAAGGPQLQWGPSPAGPPAAEGGPSLAEISGPMAGNPWLSLPQGESKIIRVFEIPLSKTVSRA